ncbi:uncharacterized protein LOC116401691 [Cucumis sativus]|uniref:uncharacterized protein LOC116401691 n=1 Tax=Cucumis sativus TaxID=3659 RepID=UPI0012F49331|nr:uncharacterized protein LOC116401691 [Cucumis sativus]
MPHFCVLFLHPLPATLLKRMRHPIHQDSDVDSVVSASEEGFEIWTEWMSLKRLSLKRILELTSTIYSDQKSNIFLAVLVLPTLLLLMRLIFPLSWSTLWKLAVWSLVDSVRHVSKCGLWLKLAVWSLWSLVDCVISLNWNINKTCFRICGLKDLCESSWAKNCIDRTDL